MAKKNIKNMNKMDKRILIEEFEAEEEFGCSFAAKYKPVVKSKSGPKNSRTNIDIGCLWILVLIQSIIDKNLVLNVLFFV